MDEREVLKRVDLVKSFCRSTWWLTLVWYIGIPPPPPPRRIGRWKFEKEQQVCAWQVEFVVRWRMKFVAMQVFRTIPTGPLYTHAHSVTWPPQLPIGQWCSAKMLRNSFSLSKMTISTWFLEWTSFFVKFRAKNRFGPNVEFSKEKMKIARNSLGFWRLRWWEENRKGGEERDRKLSWKNVKYWRL